MLDRRFGLADGFDVYDDQVPRDPAAGARLEAERRGGEVVDAALAWLRMLRDRSSSGSTCTIPHAPYTPPAEFLAKTGGQRLQRGSAHTRTRRSGGSSTRCASADVYDRAVIAIAGDHGEGLGEHGEATHGMLAYDATLRVPLIVCSRRDFTGEGGLPARSPSRIFQERC